MCIDMTFLAITTLNEFVATHLRPIIGVEAAKAQSHVFAIVHQVLYASSQNILPSLDPKARILLETGESSLLDIGLLSP